MSAIGVATLPERPPLCIWVPSVWGGYMDKRLREYLEGISHEERMQLYHYLVELKAQMQRMEARRLAERVILKAMRRDDRETK